MKIFISMGFRGRTDEFIFERRDSIKEVLDHMFSAYEIMDNFVKDIPEVNNESVWCLGDSIRIMSNADIVVFDEDFDEFRGCRIEEKIAKEYGLFRLYL